MPQKIQNAKSRRSPPRRHKKVTKVTSHRKPRPPVKKAMVRKNVNVFITTQMRTGSTWLCDLVSEIFNKRWQFWARGRDIPADRFKKHIKFPNGTQIFKMHYTPPERICECIPEGDKNNFVISITRDVKDVSISKILYMRYDSGVRNLARMQEINNTRLDFDSHALKDKEYINEFIKTKSYKHIINNWKLYNDGYKHPNYLLITYEGLNARPALTLKKIYEFLGIPISHAQHLRKLVVKNNFKQKTGRQKGDERNSAFRRKGITGDHKNYLNEESLKRIKELVEVL